MSDGSACQVAHPHQFYRLLYDIPVSLPRSAQQAKLAVASYHHHFPHIYGHARVDILKLGDITYLFSDAVDRAFADALPQNPDVSLKQLSHAVYDGEQGSLSCPVGPDYAEKFPL